MKKRTLLAVCTAIASIVAVGCATMSSCSSAGGEISASSSQTTVSVNKESAELLVGETLRLTATVSDGSDTTWTTSDETVATVRNGMITAKGVGTATITVTAGGVSASCAVTVSQGILTLSSETASVERGESYTLTASATKADGTALTGTITWESSDETIATVSNGVITAKKDGKVTITAKYGNTLSASCDVTVTWESKPADYAEISFGEETKSTANAGKFLYWNDQNWCGSNVTVDQAEYMNGEATFSYSGSTAVWFGMQVFYRNPQNEVGKYYKLTAKITSAKECDITINGTVVSLKEGENNVTVYAPEGENSSLSLQMGVSDVSIVESNTFTISALAFEEYTPEALKTPTAIAIANGVLTITDENGEKTDAYQIALKKDGKTIYQLTVENGETIDTSYMENGTYQVTVVAVGSGMYSDSAESASLTEITVSNDDVQYDLTSATEVEAVASTDKFYYCAESGGVQDATYKNGTISFKVSGGNNWYSNQIFMKKSSLTAGQSYTLTFNLNSTAAGTITVNGTKVEIKEGDNAISVIYTEAGGSASFSMQIGYYISDGAGAVDITDATIIISNIEYTANTSSNGSQEGGSQEGGSQEVSGTAISFGAEGSATGNAGTYYYWNDQGWCDSSVTVSAATIDENNTITLSYSYQYGTTWYGMQLFYENPEAVTGKTYTVTLKINSAVEGDVTINRQVVHLTVGDNEISITYTESSDDASFRIQMGKDKTDDDNPSTYITENTVKISNVTFTLATEETEENA
jgi:uncharacterized protein YjdB